MQMCVILILDRCMCVLIGKTPEFVSTNIKTNIQNQYPQSLLVHALLLLHRPIFTCRSCLPRCENTDFNNIHYVVSGGILQSTETCTARPTRTDVDLRNSTHLLASLQFNSTYHRTDGVCGVLRPSSMWCRHRPIGRHVRLVTLPENAILQRTLSKSCVQNCCSSVLCISLCGHHM